jgi:hypothetical protein
MSNDASLPAEQRRGYTGVFDAVGRVLREEGAPAFYRGSQPFVARAMVRHRREPMHERPCRQQQLVSCVRDALFMHKGTWC